MSTRNLLHHDELLVSWALSKAIDTQLSSNQVQLFQVKQILQALPIVLCSYFRVLTLTKAMTETEENLIQVGKFDKLKDDF